MEIILDEKQINTIDFVLSWRKNLKKITQNTMEKKSNKKHYRKVTYKKAK